MQAGLGSCLRLESLGTFTSDMVMPLDEQTDIPDDTLLVAYANGDQAAARQLTLRLTPRVFGQAYRILGNQAEAEDVTQDALMRLWKIAPEWRMGEAKVSTWLYRVTQNLCLDRLRRKSSASLEGVPEPLDETPGAVDVMQSQARGAALRAAIAALPERQRQAVMLRHLEELGNPEIANVMEISVEAVESLLQRGKRTLSAALRPMKDALGFEGDLP